MPGNNVVLAVTIRNGSAIVLDAKRGSVLHVFGAGKARSATINGTYVMVSTDDGRVQVYDGIRGAFLRVI